MSAPDPGLAQVANEAEDPTKGAVEKHRDGSLSEEDRPVAPDQFDSKFETGKYEIWAYCSSCLALSLFLDEQS